MGDTTSITNDKSVDINFTVKEEQFQHIKFAVWQTLFETLFNEKIENKKLLEKKEYSKQKHYVPTTKKTSMLLRWKMHLINDKKLVFNTLHLCTVSQRRISISTGMVMPLSKQTTNLDRLLAIQLISRLIGCRSIRPTS